MAHRRRASLTRTCCVAGCGRDRHPSGRTYCLEHWKSSPEYEQAGGGGYGLDADLAAKAAAKYDHGAEATAQRWIEAVIGESFPGGFAESLKNGVRLCQLINAIKPGSVRRINTSSMPFKQMENITSFLRACRGIGMAEHDLFTTVALFEEKDMGAVVQGIHALGRASRTVGTFRGPYLGPKESTKNTRQFSAATHRAADPGMTLLSAGSSQTMQRTGIDRSRDITYGRDQSGEGASGATTRLAAGSHGVMQRGGIDRGRDITFGRDHAGEGAAGATTRMGAGSHGVMQRGGIDRGRDITFGRDHAGEGAAASTSKWSAGSRGVMDRTQIDRTNDITFGADAAPPARGRKFCSECGAQNPGKFCSECGSRQ